jgi:hypothetical protein
MKGSVAFSAKSRTVRARCFLNSPSNMINPQRHLLKGQMLTQNNCGGKAGKPPLHCSAEDGGQTGAGKLKEAAN